MPSGSLREAFLDTISGGEFHAPVFRAAHIL